MRAILLVHRYLAVAIGLLMVLWCLSGFVMMYQSYPSIEPEQRRNGLTPLEFAACCDLDALDSDRAAAAPPFRVEMLLGDPVVRFAGAVSNGNGDSFSALNLRTGRPVQELTPEQVLEVAGLYGTGNGIAGEPRSLGIVDIDQWTIQTARRNRPVHHVAFDDAAGTEIYVSGATGEVFQVTTRRVRLLAWFGAVPHWLYPTLLRQNGALWTEIVIWTSVAGSFLAATGLYVGISRVRRNRQGQLASPFNGWWYWHHVSGLLFGVLALTWVFSGLMTMNPWGALTGGSGMHRAELVGSTMWGDVKQFLALLPLNLAQNEFKQLQSAPFNHRLYVLATDSAEIAIRLDVEARLAQLTGDEVESALKRLSTPIRDFDILTEEDNYYYGHKQEVPLPVYRVLLDDAEATRLYIDLESGAVRSVGSDARWSRWILGGLHSLDFPGLRARPTWDIVVSLLLAGVTLLCAIGSWLAIKRVRMDYRFWQGRRRRERSGQGLVAAKTAHD